MLYRDKKLINPTKQRGAAIIVALFVVALAVIAATMMIEQLRTDIRRTELIINTNKANLYAQGSITWAIDQLNNNWSQQKPGQIIDKTPIKSPIDTQENATISSIIYDAQGYFNLNNATDSRYLPDFLRLVQTVSPETDQTTAQNIFFAITHWISSTSKTPTLDEYYLKLSPPYQAPHRLMISVSELRLIKDVTPDLFLKLSPYIIALPRAIPTNINNATAPVIMSMSQTMELSSAEAIQQAAQQTPFTDPQQFLDFDIVKNNPIEANKITVVSNYFLVETNVTLGQQSLTLYTLLERVTQGPQSKTVVLWQSKGTR